MNPPSDVSLYELALQSEFAPTTLQISPSTLKSITDALMGILVERTVPAVVWAKLPRGEVWWNGLEQYTQLPVAQSTYLFTQQREETDELTSGSAEGTANDKEVPHVIAATAATPVVTLQMPVDSPLRREYFLLIWSEPLKVGLFAHRPRSIQVGKILESTPLAFDAMSSSYGQTSHLLESHQQERKQLLLATCSLDGAVVSRALQGLEESITAHPLHLAAYSASVAGLNAELTMTELVQHWQLQVQAIASTPSAVHIFEQLLIQQLQHQEELWQRYSIARKQAEMVENLRLQNEELTTTLRLKDDFLNNVGQELRTPLTTIKTALSLLGSPNIKPPQRQRYMDLIAKECDRQNSLITSLLDLTHLDQEAEQAALPPIRLIDVVPGVVSTYQPIAEEKGIRLSYTVPEDLPAVSCMTNWLKQIVINLLHNGIKYTLNGGNVWVRAKQQGDYVQLEVRDTGIGIAPSEIPKIFDRFYRVRQSADDSSGAGLGLTIVQQLLLHCGGSISVKSKLAEGSTFNVLLPVYKNPTDSTS